MAVSKDKSRGLSGHDVVLIFHPDCGSSQLNRQTKQEKPQLYLNTEDNWHLLVIDDSVYWTESLFSCPRTVLALALSIPHPWASPVLGALRCWFPCNKVMAELKLTAYLGFLCGSVVKNPPTYAGDSGSIPGSGRSLEEEMAPQRSCPENSMDRL